MARLGARPPLPANGLSGLPPAPDSLDPSRSSLHPLHVRLDRRAERRGAYASERGRLRRMGGRRSLASTRTMSSPRSPRSRSIFRCSIFSAPCARRPLAPIHESAMISPIRLARAIAGRRSDVLYCVPSLVLREIKSHELGWAELGGSALRHIVFAGEPINHQALGRFRPHVPDRHCIIGTGRPRPMSAAITASPIADIAGGESHSHRPRMPLCASLLSLGHIARLRGRGRRAAGRGRLADDRLLEPRGGDRAGHASRRRRHAVLSYGRLRQAQRARRPRVSRAARPPGQSAGAPYPARRDRVDLAEAFHERRDRLHADQGGRRRTVHRRSHRRRR